MMQSYSVDSVLVTLNAQPHIIELFLNLELFYMCPCNPIWSSGYIKSPLKTTNVSQRQC